ncbi:hypothetical protein [Citreicoccus inhibens]|uniref:hypothetical protein n=1 Tax=Citreicoccus inhibens TaxID=2849499 RepID=UPI001F16C4BB|nr:hypothetical protein [Citreicoccus inhibens]
MGPSSPSKTWRAWAHGIGLVLAVCGASPAWGSGWEVEYDAPATLFMDRSYLFVSPSKIHRAGDPESPTPLLFESWIAPNLFLPQLHYGDFRGKGGEYFLSLVLTPAIRLRMLSTDSSPVIPPSFLPKLTFQVAHLRLLPGSSGENAPTRGLALASHVIIGHYSNGQDGCFYGNQTGTDPHCTPEEGQLPLNELTGSFSTNLLRLELWALLAMDVSPNLDNAWLLGGRAYWEFNAAVGPGGISGEQRAVYGNGHWGLSWVGERMWHQHRFRAEALLSCPYGETPRQGATLALEVAANPRWGAGFGLFARYVHGQDYYNILFLERVNLWQFGLVFELNPNASLKASTEGRPPGFQ